MILIAQYRGKSIISRLIRWQTWSVWSHSALLFVEKDGCTLVEAWHKGGVLAHTRPTIEGCLSVKHKPGTVVNLFEVVTNNHEIIKYFALSQVGTGYDYSLLCDFITRTPASKNSRWICSELVAAACIKGGVHLQNLEPSHMSPHLVGISPILKYKRTTTTS